MAVPAAGLETQTLRSTEIYVYAICTASSITHLNHFCRSTLVVRSIGYRLCAVTCCRLSCDIFCSIHERVDIGITAPVTDIIASAPFGGEIAAESFRMIVHCVEIITGHQSGVIRQVTYYPAEHLFVCRLYLAHAVKTHSDVYACVPGLRVAIEVPCAFVAPLAVPRHYVRKPVFVLPACTYCSVVGVVGVAPCRAPSVAVKGCKRTIHLCAVILIVGSLCHAFIVRNRETLVANAVSYKYIYSGCTESRSIVLAWQRCPLG